MPGQYSVYSMPMHVDILSNFRKRNVTCDVIPTTKLTKAVYMRANFYWN